MKIAGIDWSMSSPGLVVGSLSSEYQDLDLYGFSQKRKHVSSCPRLHLKEYPLYMCQEERFDELSNWAMGIIKAHSVERVFLEGYSYGSKGVVFEIGENTAILKHKLWKSGILFQTFAPSEVKKFATGKGNSNKFAMEAAFREKTGVDLSFAIGDELTEKSVPSPASDIIDAYWIWKLGEHKLTDQQ